MVAEPGAEALSEESRRAEIEDIYLQYNEELSRAIIKKFDVSYAEAEDVVQYHFRL